MNSSNSDTRIGLLAPRTARQVLGAIFAIVAVINLAQVPGAPSQTQPWFLGAVGATSLVALVLWRSSLANHPMAFVSVTVLSALLLTTYSNFLWPDAWSYSAFYVMTFVGVGLIAPRWFALGVALPLAAALFFVPFTRHGVPEGIVSAWVVNVETWLLTYLVIRWTGNRMLASEERSRQRLEGLETVLDSGLTHGRADDLTSAATMVVAAAARLTGADFVAVRHANVVIGEFGPSDLDAATRQELVVPLSDTEDHQDALILQWAETNPRGTNVDRPLLKVFARQAATALQRGEAMEQLRDQTLIDPLTGVGNRRRADAILATASPGDGIVLIDLDHFKAVNDLHGHQVGDLVLRNIASFLDRQLRDRDHVARYGGEEFLLVVHQISGPALEELLQRLREQWNVQSPITTFSVGAAVVGARGDTNSALRTADQALYRAKEAGRDQVVIAAA